MSASTLAQQRPDAPVDEPGPHGAGRPVSALRAGLVGAGHICEFHLRALRRLRNVILTGVTDLDQERARDFARRFGVAAVYPSLDALLAAGVDVVHVLTPPGSHAAITLRALEAGCHVLVEKPLATSVEDCDRIAEAAARAGKVVGVDHAMLCDPFLRKALKLVRSGAIGEVVSAEYLRSQTYPPWTGGPLPVHYREGGYPWRDVGVHALYVLQEILGDIQDVAADFRHRDGDLHLHFNEWRALVRCRHGTGQVHLSWNIKPAQTVVVIQGTRGTIRADLFAMTVTVKRARRLPEFVQRPVNTLSEACQALVQVPWNLCRVLTGRLRRYHGVQQLVGDFYADLAAGRPFPHTPQAARPVIEWTEQVAREADAAKQAWLDRFPKKLTAPVLLTGGTGFIGGRLLHRLLESGQRVRLFARREPGPDILNNPNVEVVLGDLGDPDAVDRAVAGTELIYHVGAAVKGSAADFTRGTVAGTHNLVCSAVRHRVGKLVYISSLSVLHAAVMGADAIVREDWPLEPKPEKRGAYTRTKLEAERVVRDAVERQGLPAVILRPGLVFGPGAPLLTPSVALRRGKRLLILGDGKQELPLVYVDDLIDAILAAPGKPVFDGSVFHLVDPEIVTQNELVEDYVEATGRRCSVWHVPRLLLYTAALGVQCLAKLLRRAAPLSVYRLRSAMTSGRFDCEAARTRLGWTPRVGVREGLARTLALAAEKPA